MGTQYTISRANSSRTDNLYCNITSPLQRDFLPRVRGIIAGVAVAAAAIALPGSAVAAINVEGSMDYLINQSMTNAGDISVGLGSGNNTLTIDGATVNAGKIYLGSKAGEGESNNTIRIINGAKVYAQNVYFGTDNYWRNAKGSSTYIVEGARSVLQMKYGMVSGTNTLDFPSDNYVFIRDGGLVIMENRSSCYATNPYNTMKFVLDGGFVAYQGDRLLPSDRGDDFSMNLSSAISGIPFYWDDGSGNYINTMDEAAFYDRYSVIYYETDEAAFAATGLQGMGGHTIVSDKTFSPVPEPATYAAIFGLVVTGVVLIRCRRK